LPLTLRLGAQPQGCHGGLALSFDTLKVAS
jgi:hypothetical protein